MPLPSARALALAADSEHNRDRIAQACERAGLEVLPLPDRGAPDDVAYRLPVGLATRLHLRGVALRLAACPPDWLPHQPPEVLGRALAAVTVDQLRAGEVPLDRVRLVKLATAKHRDVAARQVDGLAQAQRAVAALPGATVLLVADDYLDCDSEYRAYTVGRDVVACSPYLVEGESWSRELVLHRASFHDDAARFVADLLAALSDGDVPPACVLDVARLPSGELRLLEVNTAWGAGLYGCDPDGVLRSVLAANGTSDPRWLWQPDPGIATLVAAADAVV